MNVTTLLEGRRLIVCAGPGGVGKTTSSAAIALGMAAAGAKVAVITIDPAKRLATALGIDELSNEAVRVPAERLERRGVAVGGELWAMALDPKRTFDELIDRLAPDRRRAEDIKSNRVYVELSTAISGSHEFTAVSKLFDLERTGCFDLVVLDTPPSANALDFLDAPRRLNAFLDGRTVKLLVKPAGLGMRVLGRGMSPLMGAFGRLSGADVLAEASSFLQLLGDMTDDFSRRATQVELMLRASTTAFLLITSTERGPVEETIGFGRTLATAGLPLAGIVVNRVHQPLSPGLPHSGVATLLARRLPADLASRVAASTEAYQALRRRDELAMSRMRSAFPLESILTVPQLPRDVHDVEALWDVHPHLF